MSLSQKAIAASRSTDYLNDLNREQRQAVENLDNPLLVLAGAGTGKTRVLTTRIAHILNMGRASSWQILAVTFTNKAAKEMKNRIGSIVGQAGVEGMPWLGTFHSIGVKILRRHAELAGLESSFTILDTDDQLRLLKQILKAEQIDEKRWPARTLAGMIDSWKNRGLLPDKVPVVEAEGFAQGKGIALYKTYQHRMKELNAVDFGDLLLEVLKLFQRHPDVLKEYQKKFRFILVDEYQDTNVAQYLWLRLLAQGDANICCVGDDDQSIYGWRGAEVDNILRFEKDFKEAQIVRLEQNYRSTDHILKTASMLISHNEERLGKTLHTNVGIGEQVDLQSVWDGEEEARTVGDDVEQYQRQGVDLNEIAVLMRASFQMRAFEDRFLTMGIPYRVVGGPRFYERAEIKDAIAYFAAMLNPSNDIKFERIINVPKRGLGDATVKIIHDYARAAQIPLMVAARQLVETEDIKPKPRATIRALMGQFESWRGRLEEMSHTELAEIILDESGYTAMWQKDKSVQAQSRLDNLKELVRFMAEFENFGGFMEHVSLVMDAETQTNEPQVSLMTLHSSKGLEFDCVFLPGWEDGLFPHQRALDEGDQEGLEEERRLAYVGITRAKKHLKILFAQNRLVHGKWQSSLPSRFIDELPEANVDINLGSSGGHGYGKNTYGSGGGSRGQQAKVFAQSYGNSGQNSGSYDSYEKSDSRGGKGSSGTYYQKGGQKDWAKKSHGAQIEGKVLKSEIVKSQFKEGERVFHQKFGYGSIMVVDGKALQIEFEKAGSKRVMDSYVEAVADPDQKELF